MTPKADSQVVTLNVANITTEPDSGAPLATQALLGSFVTAGATSSGFTQIITEDRYTGWIDTALLAPPLDTSDHLQTTIATLFAEVYTNAAAQSELLTKLVVGTQVAIARRPEIGDWVPVLLPVAGELSKIGYVHRVSLNVTHTPASENLTQALGTDLPRKAIVTALGRLAADTAKRLIGTPYLWGGCSPFGIDCSGLTQLAYKLSGIQLLRDASQQFHDRRFERVEEGFALSEAALEDGDLVVFSRQEDKRPTHIGLALGDGRFVHARGGLGTRIDSCDAAEYNQTYLGAIRLSANSEFSIEEA